MKEKMKQANALIQKSQDEKIDKFNKKVENSRDLTDEL